MKLMIADDHALVRNALTFLLNAQPDMTVVGQAADGHTLFMSLEHTEVDIVLLDISMPPGENGLQTARRIKEYRPAVKIIMLTMYDETSYVKEAWRAGLDGFILKSATDEVLLEGIRQVYRGGRCFDGYSSSMLEQLPEKKSAPGYDTLSKREKELLPLIALGYNNKEIAQRLYISVKTVEVHKANIRKKLQLANQAELLQYSHKYHLIDLD